MLICLTATIHPKIHKDYKASFDSNQRLREYVSNVFFLLTDSPFDKIVLCDNSSFSHDIFDLVKHFATIVGKEFEYISFDGDTDLVQKRGRGAGEQEILEYFLKHSYLLKNETSFYKLTGRYRVVNIQDVVASNGTAENIFFYMSPWHRRVSTAFFRVSKEVFAHYLSGSITRIDDSKGENFQIEGVYTHILKKIRTHIAPPKKLPIFLANTGSGYTLMPHIVRDTFKRLLNFLGLYSI